MMSRRFLSVLLFFVLLNSCGLETAKPFKHQTIVLASDCLTYRDSALFKSFTEKTGIKVRVRYLSPDKLSNELSTDKHDSEVDLILLRSAYDALTMERLGYFQKIPADSIPVALPENYRSKKNDVIGLGYDPYIILRRREVAPARNYSSLLTSTDYVSDLIGPTDLAAFYLFVFHKHSSSKGKTAEEWVDDFKAKQIKILTSRDTLIYSHLLFTKRSSYFFHRNTSLTSYKNADLVYPNQRIGGAYYDMPCVCIVKQARNYTNALALIRYFSKSEENISLNNRLNCISFYTHSRNKRFKRYHRSPLKMEKFLQQAASASN